MCLKLVNSVTPFGADHGAFMRKVVLIPTYWSREKAANWQENDAVYDHPTPIDEEGTLQRTLESMRILVNKDFKLVLLVCPTTAEIEVQAEKKVIEIVKRVGLVAETYLFTPSDLRRMTEIYKKHKAPPSALTLLTMSGYANVRNMCLLAADILAADVAILIDDDEVFEKSDFMERAAEFIGKRVYGDTVYGMAGYYLNKNDQYYDDVKSESWMTYWDRFSVKAKAFDEIIGCPPRIKRTPFAFGGAMVLHRDLFQCIPFDPHITRGEDVDYLINSRMYGFSFFLDNTLSIKHLPVAKKHPEWKRIREDIYRFVYQKSKLNSQYKTSNMVMVTAEDLDPYPGTFLKEDLEEKIFRSNTMLAIQYMQNGDAAGCREALNNIAISRKEAKPSFDPFSRYRANQKVWEQLSGITAKRRYDLRKVMEEHNLFKQPILRDSHQKRQISKKEIAENWQKAFSLDIGHNELETIKNLFFVKTFFENEMVFRAGDYNDTLFIVLKGEIVLFAAGDVSGHREEQEVARLSAGDVLGESCLMHKTFMLNGRAEQFTELIGIKEENIQKIVDSNPALGVKIYQLVLAKAVTKTTRQNLQKIKSYNSSVSENFIEEGE